METTSTFIESILETLEVASSTSSSIHVAWKVHARMAPFVEAYSVQYQKLESTYKQYGQRLSPSQNIYEIQNLVADTFYKVCLIVYRNDSLPMRECMGASTTNWQLPVSIGSSIGAILALSLIVFIVLLSRCQIPVNYRHKKRKHSTRYDNMTSLYNDDHFEFGEANAHVNDEEFTSMYDQDQDTRCQAIADDSSKEQTMKMPASVVALGLTQGHVHPLFSPSRPDSCQSTPPSRIARLKQFARANSIECDRPPSCPSKHQKLKERRSSLAYNCAQDSPLDDVFSIKHKYTTHKQRTQPQGASVHSSNTSSNKVTHKTDKLIDTSDKSSMFPRSGDLMSQVASTSLCTDRSTHRGAEVKRLPCLLSEDIQFEEFATFHDSSKGAEMAVSISGCEKGARPKQPKVKSQCVISSAIVLPSSMYEEDSL